VSIITHMNNTSTHARSSLSVNDNISVEENSIRNSESRATSYALTSHDGLVAAASLLYDGSSFTGREPRDTHTHKLVPAVASSDDTGAHRRRRRRRSSRAGLLMTC